MRADHASRTAEVMAFFRATESARPFRRRLFSDPLAGSFLGPGLRAAAHLAALPLLGRAVPPLADLLLPGARTSGVARTRLIDDWVADSALAGARQLVLLGAGFDSRAWRLPALAGLPVFEVDHPATSKRKQRLLLSLGADCGRVRFVPIDFARESLQKALAPAGFQPELTTVVVWEGVSNYLDAAAVDAVLHWCAGLGRGSQLIFTYVDRRVLAEPAAFTGAVKVMRKLEATGEPWTFGLNPAELAVYLRRRGLRLLADLGADAYRARYPGPGVRGGPGYSFYHAALAEVAVDA